MKEEKESEDKTLLDVFKQGDRVCQICFDNNGYKREYSGLVMRIEKHCMAIYWDMVNGKPVSGMRQVFTVFHENEIFNGNENASPITKEET